MIRKAKKNDIQAIMSFIDTYWRKGHILGNNTDFFAYEHLYGEEVTYIISESDMGEIEAIIGYIPYGKENRDVMTVMWKVHKASSPMIGIQLLEYLIEKCDVRIAASPGINPDTIAIYNFLHYPTGIMKQYYRLNKEQQEYAIPVIIDQIIPEIENDRKCSFKEYATFVELERDFSFEVYYGKNPKPLKEAWYFEKRYFNHPIYQYHVYGLQYEDTVNTILVMREINIEGHKIVRIVDVLGEYSNLQYIGGEIDRLLRENCYEYIDCYETGVQDSLLEHAGFRNRAETDNIIPNYFEPFLQKNVEIHYFSTDPDIVLFKGDGDQDRPNQ